jgi:1,4-alpha-glucan branching enzyme
MTGHIALVLHHHLPFIRHPEHEFFLEERWLFEAITETYLPLIDAWRRLERDGIPFCFTVSMTPPLANMLRDPLLISRYRRHLAQLRELATKELERTQDQPHFQYLAKFYDERLRSFSELYESMGGDIIGEYARLQNAGHLDVVTCTATHGFLPLMQHDRAAMRAQIEVACRDYEGHFGQRPQGIWLAECGYVPKVVDELLAEAGIRYFFVDSHAIEHASAPPVYGVYAPLHTPHTGVAAFARDPESSKQVWSSQEGYPGDYDYREYYRDIGYDLDMDYIAPYIHPDGIRLNTGLKYHRITGSGDHKDLYDPYRARERADQHAANFMNNRQAQIRHLAGHMDRPPLVVSPYDAELFGHWWFEGPWFLEALARHIHHDQSEIALTTPRRYLEANPANQAAWPGTSSWGGGGYSSFWCNGSNDWVYPYLHHAAERMEAMARRFPDASGDQARALNQCARELLLAQASDWAFIMQTGTTVEYAVKRTRVHLATFHTMADQIEGDCLDLVLLGAREQAWNIFPQLDYRVYAG